jgi:hypothetical protein
MLGEMEMVIYLSRLLPVHFDELDLQLSFSNEFLVFFIQHAAVQHAQPSTSISNQFAMVLDYKLRDYGSVVPQGIWTPATPGDARHYGNVSWNMPIFLVNADRKTLGLRLKQAEAGNCAELQAQALVCDSIAIHMCVKVSISRVTHREAIVRIVSTSSGQATMNRVAWLWCHP